MFRQALSKLTYMDAKQQVIRVHFGNILDGLFNHHAPHDPHEVCDLAAGRFCLPVRSQERKQRHCIPHRPVFNPAEVGQDSYRGNLPAAITCRIVGCQRRTGDCRIDDLCQFAQVSR